MRSAKSATGTDLPPTSRADLPSSVSVCVTITTFSTTASGTPYTAAPRSKSSTSMSASATGSSWMTSMPWPGSLRTSRLPPTECT